MRNTRVSLAIAAAMTLCAWSEVPAHAETLRCVQNEIAGLLAHPILREADVGVLVVSMDTGQVLFSRAPRRGLIPASNMKLVAVATALELLGPEWTCAEIPGSRPGETLADLAVRILKPSDNDLADTLMAHLPSAVGRPDLTPGQLCAETWGERRLFLRGDRWMDGSGLCRSDLMSAQTMVKLLKYMAGSNAGAEFAAALPMAGIDGTLKNRMTACRARGRVLAKTGTLTGVSALSGYAVTRAGERLAFSIIVNGFTCDVERVRRLQDQMCEVLVGVEKEDTRARR